MKIIPIILVLFFTFCSSLKHFDRKSDLLKFTFSVENIYNDLECFYNLTEPFSMGFIDSIKLDYSALVNDKIQNERRYPNEIYIQPIKQGAIYQRYVNNKFSHYLKYIEESDSIILLDYQTKEASISSKLDRSICDNYRIEIDKNNVKTIAGYKCYFVKVEETSTNKEFNEIMGNTIFEMYVTDEFYFPMYSLLKNDCYITGFSPLEVKKYQSNCEMNYFQYKLINVE